MRPRELGLPFPGVPGEWNAITDVPGVEVGFCTLIQGEDVRTGVTSILPRGRSADGCLAAIYALNGNGEMTGSHWVNESGFLEGPLSITTTHSVGVVRDATILWQRDRDLVPPGNRYGPYFFSLPVVAETADVRLNDMMGRHVREEHAFAALDSARSGPLAEGNVGGGTGMVCHGWKGGTGTASRRVGAYTLGVLLQANHGAASRLTILGVPISVQSGISGFPPPGTGSIIVIVATDAPLMPHQLRRLAARVPLGIGRTGGLGENSSGDIFLAFSTANPGAVHGGPVETLANAALNPFFEAVVEAVEEAIVNALFAAETMTGFGGATIEALPKEAVLAAFAPKLG